MRNGWRERALDRLATMPTRRVTGYTVALLVSAAALDWFSCAEIAASLGYLLPISLAAWGIGRLMAVLVGAASAGLWLAVDLLTVAADGQPGLQVVNLIVLTVAFQLFGLLLTTLREQLDHERRLARIDPLTSLHNRRALGSAMAREVERARRHGQPFSLAYIDVDGFKGVNDRFGHHAGDELLRYIADALQEGLRRLDMVARPGGDEFVLLLPGTGTVGAVKAMARLQKRLKKAAWRQAFDIDFSIGCLTVLEAPADVDAIISRADALMYAVKRTGRGQVRHDVMTLTDGPGMPAGPAPVALRPSSRAPQQVAT